MSRFVFCSPSLVLLLLITLATGCATRAPLADFPRHTTQALAADKNGPLGLAVSKPAGVDPEQSGFYLLVSGKEAFEARLALIQQAHTSLDLQYYAAAQDRTGTALLNALLAASRRGVRVRLLLDDLNMSTPDDVLAIMAVQPNFEVRVFNPITTGGRSLLTRVSAMMGDYDHLERRMHNKSLIADGVQAIIGGRNLADQYFDARPDINFRDLDVLAVGNLPGRLEASFDRYWNSKESYPLPALEPRPPTTQAIARWQSNPALPAQKPADEADDTLLPIPDAASANLFLAKANSQLTWASAWLAVDNPAKVEPADEHAADHAGSKPGRGLALAMQQARHELIILSAYFVPLDGGTAALAALQQRGVQVKVLTNSLASTDVAAVHSAYRKYRKALLASGVELHEFKPVAGRKGLGLSSGSSRASLHTKAYVVDRRILMIGSFNLDPRSVNLNTEQAVLIDSPVLAQQVAGLYTLAASPRYSYQVILDPTESSLPATARDLQWLTQENDAPVTYTNEPQAGLWRRMISGVVGLFPADSEL